MTTGRIDDLTGEVLPLDTPATVLSVGEETWELHLSDSSMAELRKQLDPFLKTARRARRRQLVDASVIREWGRNLPEPITGGRRGRLPTKLIEAYNHEHGYPIGSGS